MNRETWDRAKELIAKALDLSASDRESFLQLHCPDPVLREEIHSYLMNWDEMPTGFLEHPGRLQSSEGSDLPIGTKVGPYLVVDSLGRGGMGQVFLGQDVRLHRKVALKRLRAPTQSTGGERALVLHEARAAAQINHPNVATVHDVIEHETRTFIVMEYVEGETLSALLGRERLRLDRVVDIGRQLASALVAAHAKGVIHRDVSPRTSR